MEQVLKALKVFKVLILVVSILKCGSYSSDDAHGDMFDFSESG